MDGVSVFIYDSVGDLLEKGNAIALESGIDWLYTTTLDNRALAGSKITAMAMDLPGNSASLDLIL